MRTLPINDWRPEHQVAQIMRQLRQGHFQRSPDSAWNPRVPIIYYEETSFGGEPFQVPMIILRTPPCRWFTSGGCVMCNYELVEANNQEVTNDDLLAQVDDAIARLQPLNQYHYVFITSGGSFLDSYEVPDEVRAEILKRLRRAGLKRISFESEAKFCTDKARLKSVCDFFPGAASVGIGLESSDLYIRNVVVNKGLSDVTFERATTTLREVNIGFYTYVLLGKPFLSASEDEEDCVRTIAASREAGAFMTVVEMINIQPFTLTAWLWERNRYRPPSLWSGLRVILETPERYRSGVSVKGLEPDDGIPAPLAASESCPECSNGLRNAIRNWNLSRRIQPIDAIWQSCSCFASYDQSRALSNLLPIEERMPVELQRIAQELGLQSQPALHANGPYPLQEAQR